MCSCCILLPSPEQAQWEQRLSHRFLTLTIQTSHCSTWFTSCHLQNHTRLSIWHRRDTKLRVKNVAVLFQHRWRQLYLCCFSSSGSRVCGSKEAFGCWQSDGCWVAKWSTIVKEGKKTKRGEKRAAFPKEQNKQMSVSHGRHGCFEPNWKSETFTVSKGASD